MFMSAMNDDASPAGRILSNLTTTTLLSLSSLVQTHSATAASALLHTGSPTGNLSGGTRNPMLDFSHGASTGLVGGPNDQPAWLPASVTMVRGACLVVFSVLGACFNTFMIVAIAPNRRLRTVRNILLVHLGAVGLLSSMFTTAYPAIATFHGQWLGGRSMCQTYAYVTCVFTSVSVWTIAALSWDKYQTIASPLHHSLTASIEKMLPCFLAFWACGVILSLPPLLGANEFVFHTTMGICGVNHSSSRGRWYTCLLVAASFVLPFCLMLYCYAHIFRIARTQSSRIAATMLRMVSVIQAPIAAPAVATSHGSSSLSLRGTKAMGTILQLIGSFVLTYLPYSIIVLYEVVFAQHANAVFVSIATTLFLAAPFTHAAIYGLRNQILRTSFYRYSRRKYQDMRGRRGACCWARCCRGGTSSSRDKRRGSVKVPSGNKPAHSVSYVKRGSMGQPQAMRCVVKADGRQYVLRRAVSYQEHHNGLDHHHRHDHQYQQDTGPSPSLGQDNPHSPGPLSNGQPSSVLGAPGKTGISIPRPHSFSDVFRSASVNSLGNANPGVTCYPTSPLLLHHNGTGHGKNLGYSSLLEGCVGLQGPAEATLPNSASFCAAADEPPSSASSSYYHIPDCRVQRSHQQPANHHHKGKGSNSWRKGSNSWRENSVFGKDLLEEMNQMEDELDSISRADDSSVDNSLGIHFGSRCHAANNKIPPALNSFKDFTNSKRDRDPRNRVIPFSPPSPPSLGRETEPEQEVARSRRVRDGLMVKLSQMTSGHRAVSKKPSFGSAGSRGMGSIEDSSVFEEAGNSPDTEAKSSLFGSGQQLNDLDSFISIEDTEKNSIFSCVDDMELSNFQLEPERAMRIVSSQV